MMLNRQERDLLEEAEWLRNNLTQEAAGQEIRQAVQRGLAAGRFQAERKRTSAAAIFGLAAAAVIAVLLFFIPPMQDSPSSRTPAVQQTEDWGGLEGFKHLVASDIDRITLESAIRHNYIQPVNLSTGTGPYRITINAVTADENRIILLYTATTDATQEIYSVSSSRLKKANAGDYLENEGGMGVHEMIDGEDNYHQFYGKSVIRLDRSEPFPEQMDADFQIASVDIGKMELPGIGSNVQEMNYSPRMSISFKLDARFKQYLTKIIEPGTTFSLAGQEVTLERIELSPLMVRAKVSLANAPEHSWQVKQEVFEAGMFAQMTATTGAGSVKLPQLTGYGTDDGYEQIFSSNMLDDPSSFLLSIPNKAEDEKAEELRFELLP